MNRESIIYTVIFTFILTVIFVAILSLVEIATRSQVSINREVAEYGAVLDALGRDVERSNQEILADYRQLFPASQAKISYPLKTAINGEKVVIDYFRGKGLWGAISGVIAVTAQVDRIIGLIVVEQNETPGLGGRIVETQFKEQFRNEKIGSSPFKVSSAASAGGDANHDNSSFDAIAGATLTSRYMRDIVNNAITSLRQQRDEGGLE